MDINIDTTTVEDLLKLTDEQKASMTPEQRRQAVAKLRAAAEADRQHAEELERYARRRRIERSNLRVVDDPPKDAA